MKPDNSLYCGLIDFGKQNREILKSVNVQVIELTQSNDVSRALKALPDSKTLASMQYGKEAIKTSSQFGDITLNYDKVLDSYNSIVITKEMRQQLVKLQLESIAQLCSSHETKMIRDAIKCFANVEFENLPNIINTAINNEKIEAADIAFVKTGKIIPVIKSEIKYPRGLTTTLNKLNVTTAQDISKSSDIKYDAKKKLFISKESNASAKCMNIICAGKNILGEDELFTEGELVDFLSILSDRPMVALNNDTGKKIYDWLRELNSNNTNIIGFDCDYYYHSRLKELDACPYTFEEMNKPPYGISETGRFNHSGRSSYYFSDKKNGAEAEVKKHIKKDGPKVPQTVKLEPKRDIRMLDFSNKLKRGETFWRMISYSCNRNAPNKTPKEYLLPNFVADCCKDIGIEGIKYYGSKEYSNYVCWDEGYFKNVGMCE